jgi:hypothetical protein
MGKMLQNAYSLKPLGQLKPNCPTMIIGRSSTKYMFFMSIGNPIGHLGFPIGIKNIQFVEDLPMMIPGQFGFNCPSGFREEVYIEPYGENVSKRFFSESTWTVETKLPKNDHWKVLYKFLYFWRPSWISDRHKKHTICRGPSNDDSWAVWFQLS